MCCRALFFPYQYIELFHSWWMLSQSTLAWYWMPCKIVPIKKGSQSTVSRSAVPSTNIRIVYDRNIQILPDLFDIHVKLSPLKYTFCSDIFLASAKQLWNSSQLSFDFSHHILICVNRRVFVCDYRYLCVFRYFDIKKSSNANANLL